MRTMPRQCASQRKQQVISRMMRWVEIDAGDAAKEMVTPKPGRELLDQTQMRAQQAWRPGHPGRGRNWVLTRRSISSVQLELVKRGSQSPGGEAGPSPCSSDSGLATRCMGYGGQCLPIPHKLNNRRFNPGSSEPAHTSEQRLASTAMG